MTNSEALKFAEEMHSKLSYRLECAQNIPARSYYEKQDEMLVRAISALLEQEKRQTPKTNADRIRAMSDEDLAKEFICIRSDWDFETHVGCFDTEEEAIVAELKWLQRPVEEHK